MANYVTVPSIAETDAIINNNLLSTGVKRDLLALHRINKSLKDRVIEAFDILNKYIDDNNIDTTSSVINHIEVNYMTADDSDIDDILNSIHEVFIDKNYSDYEILSTIIVLTTLDMGEHVVISKYGVIKYMDPYKGNVEGGLPNFKYIDKTIMV